MDALKGNKKILIPVAVLLLIVVFGGGWIFMTGGSSEAETEAGLNPDQVELIDWGDGNGAASGAGGVDVAAAVAATVAAMSPTATPQPTPDIAATLQAELTANRADAGPLLGGDPLRQGFGRNPYLNPVEFDYFQSLGGQMWVYVRMWVLLDDVLLYNTEQWSVDLLDLSNKKIRRVLVDEIHAGRSIPGEGSNAVVQQYAEALEDGFSSLRDAALQLEAAQTYLEEKEDEFAEEFKEAARAAGADPDTVRVPGYTLTGEDRGRLATYRRDIVTGLEAYHQAMSSYGCSVCGELFRAPPLR